MLERLGFGNKKTHTAFESFPLERASEQQYQDGPLDCILANVNSKNQRIIDALGLTDEYIEVHCEKKPYLGIRLYNVWRDFLHVAGIKLLLDGAEIANDVLPPFSCQVGKEYNNEGKCAAFEFGVISDKYAFHTTREEENCWFEASFDTPVVFNEIRVYTRKKHEYRAISMCVDTVSADGARDTVYSGLSMLDDAVAKRAEGLTNSLSLETNQVQYLYKLFWLASDDTYKYPNPVWLAVLADAEKYGFTENELKAFIGDFILEKREQSFTSYGVRRCFRFWSEDELTDYLQATRDAIDQLYDFCDSVFYAYGTLLGFIREPSGFIPHDIDIDIVCVFPMTRYHSLAEINKEMKPFLESRKFKIVTQSQYSYHVKYKNNTRFDVFPALADARGNVTIYPSFKGKYLNTSYLIPTIDIEVRGISCPIPKNPFEFLSTVYGPDWRIPRDKNFHVKEDE